MRLSAALVQGLSLLFLAAAPAGPRKPDPAQGLRIVVEEGLQIRPCGAGSKDAENGRLHVGLPCLETTLRLGHLAEPHRLRFVYFDPAGELYVATRADWTVGPTGTPGYHRSALVRHRLQIAGEQASVRPGRWKAAAWLDGLTVSELDFQLQRSEDRTDPGLAQIRRLYLELRYEEALEQAESLGTQPGNSAAVRAEALWWLALAGSGLQQPARVEPALLQLLQAEPAFSLEPAALEQIGGVDVAQRLEVLRMRHHPQLYRKTTVLPEAELSPAQQPPVLAKRRPWYQRWWFYAALGAVAIPVTAALVGGDTVTVEEGPPSLSLSVTKLTGIAFCPVGVTPHGAMSLNLRIDGGQPPFEVLYTVASMPQNPAIRIEGFAQDLGMTDVILVHQTNLQERLTSPTSAAILIVAPTQPRFPTAVLRFGVIVRDAGSSARFDGAAVGAPVPGSVLELLSRDPRVVQHQIGQSLTRCP